MLLNPTDQQDCQEIRRFTRAGLQITLDVLKPKFLMMMILCAFKLFILFQIVLVTWSPRPQHR